MVSARVHILIIIAFFLSKSIDADSLDMKEEIQKVNQRIDSVGAELKKYAADTLFDDFGSNLAIGTEVNLLQSSNKPSTLSFGYKFRDSSQVFDLFYRLGTQNTLIGIGVRDFTSALIKPTFSPLSIDVQWRLLKSKMEDTKNISIGRFGVYTILNGSAYTMKNDSLEVDVKSYLVKAGASSTLFMMNTGNIYGLMNLGWNYIRVDGELREDNLKRNVFIGSSADWFGGMDISPSLKVFDFSLGLVYYWLAPESLWPFSRQKEKIHGITDNPWVIEIKYIKTVSPSEFKKTIISVFK